MLQAASVTPSAASSEKDSTNLASLESKNPISTIELIYTNQSEKSTNLDIATASSQQSGHDETDQPNYPTNEDNTIDSSDQTGQDCSIDTSNETGNFVTGDPKRLVSNSPDPNKKSKKNEKKNEGKQLKKDLEIILNPRRQE